MTFAYLDDQTLREVRDAAVELGYASDGRLAALAEGISPAFIATCTQGSVPYDKLFALTWEMNKTRALVSGEVPLTKWLTNAIDLAGDRPEGMVFRRALERASADGMASSGAAPRDLDVNALPASDGKLEIKIGEDDTLGVAFLHDGSAVSRSVAKLLVHRHFGGHPSMLPGDQPDFGNGTGWLLAPRLLITNFHVIKARLPLEDAPSAEDIRLQAASMRAQFGFYRTDSEVCQVRAVNCVASDPALDYALLRLPEASPDRPALRLRGSPIRKPKDRALRERVNVLQHPDGEPMKLGFRNNFVVAGDETRLSYLTDTAGGSSGSPICDDAWFVAALHRGFTTITGKPVTVWGKAISQENYGTPIGQILDHLAANHPDLRAEVEAGQAGRKRSAVDAPRRGR